MNKKYIINGMTVKQKRLAEFIETFKRINGYDPTQKICAEYMKVSQQAVAKMLKKIKA